MIKVLWKGYLLLGVILVLSLNGCATAMLTESANTMYSIIEPVHKYDDAYIKDGVIAIEFLSGERIYSHVKDPKCEIIKEDQCINSHTVFYDYKDNAYSSQLNNYISSKNKEENLAYIPINKNYWNQIEIEYINIDDALNDIKAIHPKPNWGLKDKLHALLQNDYLEKNKSNESLSGEVLYIAKSHSEPYISAATYSSGDRTAGILQIKKNDKYTYFLLDFNFFTYLGQGGSINKLKYIGVPFAFVLDVVTFPISIPMYYGLKNMGN